MAPLITLGQAKAALAQRLYDSSEQFWADAELTLYIQESMRTWQALTSYWREEFVFSSGADLSGGYGVHQYGQYSYGSNTVGDGTFFDITVLPGTVRPFTVTDNDIYQMIEYHLLEPPTITYPLAWNGSAQFTLSDLMQAVERRRNEILEISGCTISVESLTAPSSARVTVPSTVAEIRRIAFTPANPNDGGTQPMFQDDQWALQAFRSGYTTQPAGIPDVYSISTEPIVPDASLSAAITFDVSVPPGVPGSYQLLTLENGPALSTTAATVINIPNDWTWVLKWGALADLLGRESNAKDALRAKYCQQRNQQGIALLSAAPAILTMRFNDTPMQVDAITAADEYNPTWQWSSYGDPDLVLTAGLNLFALASSGSGIGHNQGGYNQGGYGGGLNVGSVTAMMVSNAPIPTVDAEPVLVTQDILDTLLDYAQHLASFKMGGAEFVATIPLMQSFMHEAALQYSRLGQQGEFQQLLWQRSQVEVALNPRYTADVAPEGGS